MKIGGKNNKMRSGKFYRKNEREVMKNLGLKPTKNSGSGWIEKEDGENETIIAQLKSTDSESIKVNLLDLKKLFYHANISHKTGVFIIQFLQENEEFIIISPEDLQKVAKGLKDNNNYNYTILNKVPQNEFSYISETQIKTDKIKSGSKNARSNFYKQREEMYNAKRKN